MIIQFFKPRNKFLHPYLEGYYFLTHSEDEPAASYLTFPNNFGILSVCENVALTADGYNMGVKQEQNGRTISELICHYRKPIRFTYEGRVNEITFYFRPLGLNAFLREPLSAYTSEYFSNFEPYDDYQSWVAAILDEEDINIKCELIETYLLSKFVGFTHPLLSGIIEKMMYGSEMTTIEELAELYNVSRQYIYKQFALHLCKTPVEFRKVQRFRDVLIQSIKTREKKETLTALSYDSLFYDQSHLIKDFKSLTGLTPRKFFEQISFQENATINWLYL